MKSDARTLVFLCLALFICARSGAATATFSPVADAELRQHTATANFGTAPTMVSGALGPNATKEIRRALMRFDLSSLPAGAVIQSASLTVSVVQVPLGPANSVFDLRRLLQPWNETQVSWNARSSGQPWQAAGVNGPDDVALVASGSVAVSELGTYTFASGPGLVTDIQAWADSPPQNFGWLLVSEDEVTPKTARHFATREAAAATRPVLTIEYTLPLGPAIATQPTSQSVQSGQNVTFAVEASGTPPLAYQWYFQLAPLAGATNAVLELANVTTNFAGNYFVTVSNSLGTTTSAVAVLTVSSGPLVQPSVNLLEPTNGAHFAAHSDITVSADAFELGGAISQVEFLLGTNSIGVSTTAPYTAVIAGLERGTYSVSARATDREGISATSTAVRIVVHDPPDVQLRTSAAGDRLPLGGILTNFVTINTDGLRVTNVTLFEGANAIGSGVLQGSNSFQFTWLPNEPRSYVLTATATDELGQIGVSSPVLVLAFLPERTKPSLDLTRAPRNFSRLTTSLLAIAGTAHDNVGLDHIEYQVNNGAAQRALGIDVWSADVFLLPGNNIVRVRAVDLAGNLSFPVTRYLTLSVLSPLTVLTSGEGTVHPDLNGRELEIGRFYKLNARAKPGHIFAGWSTGPGAALASTRSLTFQMRSNLVLTATFVPDPFAQMAHTYDGVFFNPTEFPPLSWGMVHLTTTSAGAFSGKLYSQGQGHSFTGKLDPSGRAAFPVLRRGDIPLHITLELDRAHPGIMNGSVTDGSWTAALKATGAARNLPALKSTDFILQATNPGSEVTGVGQIAISASGAALLRGSLDGRQFVVRSSISADGDVPVYQSFEENNKALVGWLHISPVEAVISGAFFWADLNAPQPVTALSVALH